MEITVPQLGESVTEATVAKWFKSIGDAVIRDEPLVELETDKVTLEINAAEAGTLTEIAAAEGSEVEVGALLGIINAGGATNAATAPPAAAKAPEPTPAAPRSDDLSDAGTSLSPAVRKLVDENGLDPSQITGTGKDGRLTKGDVLAQQELLVQEALIIG